MTRNKEVAIAAGIKACETKHSMKRRAPWHDYYKKGTYMLTLVVAGRKPLLGRLVTIPGEKPPGTGTEPPGTGAETGMQPLGTGTSVTAMVELTELGKAIRDEEIRKIAEHYKMVEVWKLCVMPDHIHMIVRVKEEMPKGKNLGQVVWGFKVGCTKAWWRLMPGEKPLGTGAEPLGTGAEPPGTGAEPPGTGAEPPGTVAEPPGTVAEPLGTGTGVAPVPVGSSTGESLFEPGYNDKILLRDGQLDIWKRYLDDNPRRLAIKRLRPDYFTIIHEAEVVGRNCQMVGNRFLLDIPQKMAVIVHSAYSDKDYADWRRQWLACGEAGGVLVSAAIATREKEMMREAMDCGYNIILLRENGFPPLYKPSGESFITCSEGRLLQISPWEYHMERKTISREQCLMLNRMAEEIAEGKYLQK